MCVTLLEAGENIKVLELVKIPYSTVVQSWDLVGTCGVLSGSTTCLVVQEKVADVQGVDTKER